MVSRNGLLKSVGIVCNAAILLLIIFSGCAKKEAVKAVSDEDVLRERVMTYWDHKVKEEFDKSYEYEYPYYRKTINMIKYIQGFNTVVLEWRAAAIKDVKIEADQAVIDMRLSVKVRVPDVKKPYEYDTLVKEKWLRFDGVWYHIPSNLPEGKVN